jgi:hypothetical protein
MKRIIIASTLLLVFAIGFSACEKYPKNKGNFERKIPPCIKENIKNWIGVICVEEYCTKGGTRKIYHFIYKEGTFMAYPAPLFVYDENCSSLLIQTEENPFIVNPDHIDVTMFGTMYPNGTIEYKDEIYSFKRIVFTQKK